MIDYEAEEICNLLKENKVLKKEIKLLKEKLCTKTWKEVEINLDKDLLIAELKEQLKQKSNDIEKCVKVAKEQIDKTFNAECELSIAKTNQNQLAIEELSILQACILGVSAYKEICEYIERRIKELRGNK